MTENIDPNDIEDCQKQVFDLEAEVRELRAALERARALTSRNQILSPVTQDEFRQLAAAWEADRAALEQLTNELAAARENHIDANKRNMTANERADRAEAAMEQARALASRWRDTLCLFPNLEALVDEIDALLAAAPGGAA